MKTRIFYYILIFFAYTAYADNNDLLNDYKLLYIDLLNLKTWGYKSFYNNELNRSNETINISQGTIQITENNFDCAIVGEGFFKIRLDNNLAAYTRDGNFRVDENGVIVTPQGYQIYENICLGEQFLPESFKITKDHNIYVNIVNENQELVETQVGKLLTYKIPNEYLKHYEGAIYIIKDNMEYEEEIIFDNYIIQGALELSNYALLPVVLRMYYILSVLNENVIPNIEFKKELLKMQIEKMSNNNYLLDNTIYSLNSKINGIIDVLKDNNLLDTEEEMIFTDGLLMGLKLKHLKNNFNLFDLNIAQEYIDSKFYYLEAILPFINLDY
jgi:flagellar basal body rod protein FlgF